MGLASKEIVKVMYELGKVPEVVDEVVQRDLRVDRINGECFKKRSL